MPLFRSHRKIPAFRVCYCLSIHQQLSQFSNVHRRQTHAWYCAVCVLARHTEIGYINSVGLMWATRKNLSNANQAFTIFMSDGNDKRDSSARWNGIERTNVTASGTPSKPCISATTIVLYCIPMTRARHKSVSVRWWKVAAIGEWEWVPNKPKGRRKIWLYGL